MADTTTAYATIDQVTVLWRPLTADEQERASALLPVISDMLRQEAEKIGKDLDEMIENGEVYSSVVMMVTVDVLSRVLRQATTGEAMSQESQSALGYNWSGTYAVPGGGVGNAIMRNDLKRLGLLHHGGIKVVELYEPYTWHPYCPSCDDSD